MYLSLCVQVVTDVEGSTQLWEWDSVVMGAAVEQHNVVLRGLLDQYGGHEVRTDGDSFTLAFHDAADAVAYCIQVDSLSWHIDGRLASLWLSEMRMLLLLYAVMTLRVQVCNLCTCGGQSSLRLCVT